MSRVDRGSRGRFGGSLLIWIGSGFLIGCVGSDPGFLAESRGDGTLDRLMEREDPIRSEIRRIASRDEVGLEDLLRIADLNNPDIAAARAEIEAATGRIRQAGLYPNPRLEFEAENVPSGDRDLGGSENTLSWVQPIPIGGRRRAGIAAASHERESRIHAYEAVRRMIHGDVRMAHVESIYLDRAIALHEDLLETARQTREIAEARFAARAVPESEAIKARIEAYTLRIERDRLARERSAVTERLRSLLGGVAIPADHIHGELVSEMPEPGDLERLRIRLRETHPAIASAREEIEAAEARHRQARAERIPDIGLKLGYGRDEAADENFWQAGIGITIPLFDRNQGRLVETEAMIARAGFERAATEQRLAADLAETYQDFASAREASTFYRERILPDAERSLSQTQAGYRAGRVSFLELLDAQRTLTGARVTNLALVREMHAARARLHRILGPEWERGNE